MSPWNAASQTYVCDRCAEHMTEAEYQQAGLCDNCSEKGYQLVALRPGFWTLVDKRGRELKDITMEQPNPPEEDTMPSFPHQQPATDPPADDDEDPIDVDDVDSQPEDPDPEDPSSESTEPTNPAPDADERPAGESQAVTIPQFEPTTATLAGEPSQTAETHQPDPSPSAPTTNGTRTERFTGVVEHIPDPNRSPRPTKTDLRRLTDLLHLDALRTQRTIVLSEDKIDRAIALGESKGLTRAIRAIEKRFDL